MASAKEIASDMISVISEERSEDGWLAGLAQGLLDFPVEMFYLGYDYLDTENRYRNSNDKYRVAKMLDAGMANRESLQRILEIVLSSYFEKLDDNQKTKLVETKLAKLAGGFIAKNIILGDIGALFASRLASKMVAGFVMTSVLSFGGMVSRAVYTSNALKDENPALYWKLRLEGNLDLLYFIVEDAAQPFERALMAYEKDKILFDNIFNEFVNGLSI